MENIAENSKNSQASEIRYENYNPQDIRKDVIEIAEFLESQKCKDVIALDLKGACSWTDYFVVATVGSSAHAGGVVKYLNELLDEKFGRSFVSVKKALKDRSWIFIDCPGVGIHIMNGDSREFYNLENLWYMADKIF